MNMPRRVLAMVAVLALVVAAFAIRSVEPGNKRELTKILPRELPTLPNHISVPPTPVGPVRSTDELNSAWQIGTTYLDFFTYGSHNRFLARDTMGGLHAAWMNARAPSNGDRVVAYNYREPPAGAWALAGAGIGGGAGFSSIDVLSDGRAVIAAHKPVPTTPTVPGGYYTFLATDEDYQISGFNPVQTPNPTTLPNDTIIWPVMSVDRQNRAQIISRDMDGGRGILYNRMFYSRSDNNQRNLSSFSYAFRGFQASYGSATSRISDKVAVAWPQTAIPGAYEDPHGWRGFLVLDYNNDLWISQSTDGGSTWNFDDTLHNNITKFKVWNWDRFTQSENLDTLWAAGDTFRHVNATSMVYDNNDHLHIVFNVVRFYEDLTVDTTVRPRDVPVKRVGFMPTLVYHWTDAAPDTFNIVADGWWWPVVLDSRDPPRWRQETRTTIDRMSLSIATNNELYCAFSMFGNTNSHVDTSSNGYAVSNIWVTHSVDNGTTWYWPTPITDTTNSNGAASGSAHSRIWPSMPEVIDNDSLYVMYIDDRSAGSTWIDGGTSTDPLYNDWTLNPVIVQSVARSAIRSDSTLTYPDYPPLRSQYRFDPNAPILRITGPAPGLYLNSPITFNWIYRRIADTSHVKLELNRDYPNGEWELIDTPLISDTTYSWPFEEEYNLLRVRFRISLLSNPNISDVVSEDDAPRDLSLATIRLVFPTSAYLTNPVTLQWDYIDTTTNGDIRTTDTVRIEVMQNYPNGQWSLINSAPITNDTMMWRFDNSYLNSSVKFRISIQRDPTINDITWQTYNVVAGVNEKPQTNVVTTYQLKPAYPNPFNPFTTIRFAIPFRDRVTLKAYDITGKEVATLVDNVFNAGEQRITWRPSRLASGVYFIKMSAGHITKTEKVIFMK